MPETYWQKRLAEPKGWVEYNPNEAFVIHVQWVVANRAAADEMLAALRRCAEATLRDAPPVVSYFFRISHDQRLAESMKKAVATIGDHPQYKKKYDKDITAWARTEYLVTPEGRMECHVHLTETCRAVINTVDDDGATYMAKAFHDQVFGRQRDHDQANV